MPIAQEAWMDAARQVAAWRRPILFSHVRPDGDAIGAVVAMTRILRALGTDPIPLLFEDVPPRYARLAEGEPIARWSNGNSVDRADGILVLDTCSWPQLEPAARFLRTSSLPRVVVDHHKTRDALRGAAAPTEPTCLIDETASATCLLLYDWATAARWPLDRQVADPLFVGMATDTGWFRFSNTDARTLRAAAALVEAGTSPDLWFTRVFESLPPSRLRLEAILLENTRLSEDGRIAWSVLTRAAFERAGALHSETEDLIALIQRVEGVVVSILFVEEADGRTRVSLRSKSPATCGFDVDVAAVAKPLGGGGHDRAAGLRLCIPIDAARPMVLEAVSRALAARAR